MFEGSRGVRVNTVTDGTSHTIMLVAARDPVVWSKPEELPFDANSPLPPLGADDATRLLIGCADGSTRFVPPRSRKLLRQMITRNGGEVISALDSYSELNQHSPAPPYRAIPDSAVIPIPLWSGLEPDQSPIPRFAPPDLTEERLQRLEEKLDRLLEKLDPQPRGGKP